MLKNLFKWGGIPISAILFTLSVISQARETSTWGIPSWGWSILGFALLVAVSISIIVGLSNENSTLRKKCKSEVAPFPVANTLSTTQSDVAKESRRAIEKTVIADFKAGKLKAKGIKRTGIENLTEQDLAMCLLLSKQMESMNQHGHHDFFGLLTDIACGVDLNQLMRKDCTVCGKPRNTGKSNG